MIGNGSGKRVGSGPRPRDDIAEPETGDPASSRPATKKRAAKAPRRRSGPSRVDRMQALAKANGVRHARAQLKRQIASGEQSAADIILSPPHEAENWPLVGLLASQPRWGEARCRKLLSQVAINERKPIGKLTARQRRLIAKQLDR